MGIHRIAKGMHKTATIFLLVLMEERSSNGPAWPVCEYISKIKRAKNQKPKSTINPAER